VALLYGSFFYDIDQDIEQFRCRTLYFNCYLDRILLLSNWICPKARAISKPKAQNHSKCNKYFLYITWHTTFCTWKYSLPGIEKRHFVFGIEIIPNFNESVSNIHCEHPVSRKFKACKIKEIWMVHCGNSDNGEDTCFIYIVFKYFLFGLRREKVRYICMLFVLFLCICKVILMLQCCL
jgi:hypothetical protein